MKLTFLFSVFFAITAMAAGGYWKKGLRGMGTGSTRSVAVKSAHNNLDLEIESHEELCRNQGGRFTVDQSPEDHCQQFYPTNNWRCSVVATAVCQF